MFSYLIAHLSRTYQVLTIFALKEIAATAAYMHTTNAKTTKNICHLLAAGPTITYPFVVAFTFVKN